MFEVVVLKVLPGFGVGECDFLFSFVSLEKRVRIERFSFFEAVRNSLLGDVLVRVELCRITGLSNRELVFDVNSHGKPFLVNTSGVHYNISHVGDCIVCVVGDVPVGVDVEFVKPFDVSVVERFFTVDEQVYVLSSKCDVRNMRFFEVWTKKESRIKCEGKNLGALSSFSVLDSLGQFGIFYHCVCYNGEVIGYVCSSKKESPSIRVIDSGELLQRANCLNKIR